MRSAASGKRSSFYSDYTFGVWRWSTGVDELVPVGKAYFGFTDEELIQIDRLRPQQHDQPLRAGARSRIRRDEGLVLEVAFEGLQRSTRHKSGHRHALPPHRRIRWDKPPGEADRIEALEAKLVS
jgi:DNA ligase-1